MLMFILVAATFIFALFLYSIVIKNVPGEAAIVGTLLKSFRKSFLNFLNTVKVNLKLKQKT